MFPCLEVIDVTDLFLHNVDFYGFNPSTTKAVIEAMREKAKLASSKPLIFQLRRTWGVGEKSFESMNGEKRIREVLSAQGNLPSGGKASVKVEVVRGARRKPRGLLEMGY